MRGRAEKLGGMEKEGTRNKCFPPFKGGEGSPKGI